MGKPWGNDGSLTTAISCLYGGEVSCIWPLALVGSMMCVLFAQYTCADARGAASRFACHAAASSAWLGFGFGFGFGLGLGCHAAVSSACPE